MEKILIAGGDMRQLYCGRRLSGKFEVSVTGFDGDMLPDGIAEENDGKCRYAVLPVPPLDESGNVNTPCFSGSMTVSDVKRRLAPDAVIFAGRVNDELRLLFDGYEVLDYMEREELSLRNAVPTAEGAVQIALEEMPVTLSGTKVLIVGMGRIGTALAEILKGFGADITAAVRNAKGAAKAALLGVKAVCTKEMPHGYGLVFNTVPSMIFGREELSRFGKDTLFIDLASKPGGIDLASAQELGMKVVWALGLPGKTASVTAGEIIAETIKNMISERGDDHVR
ncbi:MAG: dipicolinate synthase subunit A [Ruminococcus sp.]|nr:dipicolinate synthase subunit A [Ruminococcus sp.]